MTFDRRVARIVAHHPRLVYLGTALVVLASALALFLTFKLNSDVLDLLPRHFPSVQAFKVFDREFTQAHELTFVLWDEKKESDLDAFTSHFAESVRKEPWALRAMDRSPMEADNGLAEVQTIALPLLMNLPPEEFDAAVALLEPDAIRERLQRAHREIEAGSPKAEMELSFDPLGVVTRALKPLAGSAALEPSEPLASEDGTTRLVLVVTKQHGLGAHECQRVMREVEAFKERLLTAWQGPAPQILVTGRTPYVAEMSLSMRRDIVITLLQSIALVAGVFYLGFRKLRPLFAMMNVLLLCCIISIAAGSLIFHGINMITIGLCAILVGLGVDFGMMLYSLYQRERAAGMDHETAIASAIRAHGSAIFFGAITTAAAFACLLMSDSVGFAQLGVLIAIGICLAGFLMMTLFFAFIGPRNVAPHDDVLFRAGHSLVNAVFHRPRLFVLATLLLLAVLTLFAFAPWVELRFEGNPRSLEPRNSKAGFAVRKIQEKLKAARVEPLIALLRSPGSQEFHDDWQKLQAQWKSLQERGIISSFASPAPFALSPDRTSTNARKLPALNLAASRETLHKTLEAEGFNADSFRPAFAMIDGLQAVATGSTQLMQWDKALPETSSWWFLLDRFLSPTPNVGSAYITPLKTVSSFEEKERLREQLAVPEVPLEICGWSWVMADLAPWAKGKMWQLTGMMLVFNTVLLVFLYRRLFPLFVLTASLFLSFGALIATLKLLGVALNLFNVLAFPLVLGVAVDYGIYIVIAARDQGDVREHLATVVKPVVLSGLTTICGFGSLITSSSPALSGLGAVCATGIAWCLFSSLFFILPAYVWKGAGSLSGTARRMSRNRLYRLGTFRAALALAKVLPRGAAQSLAGSLGSLSYSLSRRAREALRQNLALVTRLEGRPLDDLCQANFSNFLRMLADYFHCANSGPEIAYALLEEWRGFENLEEARARGKGVIVVTGHLGNWELGGALLTQKGLPMTVVTLDEPTNELTRWRDEYRLRMGIRTIAIGKDKFAFVEMIATLKRNEVLAMLVDRPYEGSGTAVDFFNRRTVFSTGPALLWQHTGAAVLPAFVLQKPGGRYLSFAEPIIPFQSSDDADESIVRNTQQLATIFEQIIRNHPDQWYNYVPIWKDHEILPASIPAPV